MVIAFLIAFMILCYTFQSLFEKYFAMHYDGDSSTASLVFTVIYGVFIAVATLAADGFSFSPSPLTVGFALLNALILLIYHLTQIGASMRGSYAILNLCMLFGGIIIPMIASMITLKQRLTGLQIAAVVVMFGAFLLLNIQGATLTGTKPGYWLCCILLALSNGLYGALNSLQSGLMEGAERTEMIALSYFGSAVLAFVAMLFMRRKKTFSDFKMKPKAILFALGCCVAATVAVNLVMYLLSQVNTTVLNTLDNGGVMVTSSLCAFFLFGERPTKIQLCGLGCALCSIVMLSL